jgi:hypothetical protein
MQHKSSFVQFAFICSTDLTTPANVEISTEDGDSSTPLRSSWKPTAHLPYHSSSDSDGPDLEAGNAATPSFEDLEYVPAKAVDDDGDDDKPIHFLAAGVHTPFIFSHSSG